MTGDALRDDLVVVREREPGLARQPDVARVEFLADLIEREGALADEATVDAGRQGPSPCRLSRRLRNGRPTTTPSSATAMASDRLHPDRAVGHEEGEKAGRERADREEDREEGRAGEFQHEQGQRGHEPDRVDRHHSGV